MRRKKDMDRLVELVRLHRMGTGSREVARLLSMSPNTERQYRRALDDAGLLAGAVDALPSAEELRRAVGEPKLPPQQVSSVEQWRPEVEELLSRGAGPQAIWDHLRTTRTGFEGSRSAIKRLCLRIAKERGVSEHDVAVPVETKAGQVAQVDFGYVGKLLDPVTMTLRKAYVFVLVLGFSRHMFARVVFDQKTTTWLELHTEAFRALGGVPAVMVPDNLKAAVIRAAFGVDDDTVLNRSYRELARHFGFKIDPAPPLAPKKKGKVESGVGYVKRNFMSTIEEGARIDEVNAQLDVWVRDVAGLRSHGTTGKRPLDVFVAEEQSALLPLPPAKYELAVFAEPTLGKDCLFAFDGAHYSAPWRLVGQKLRVRATAREVFVFFDDARVATHPRVPAGRKQIDEEHLPPGRRDFRHRDPEHWLARARAIGPEVGAWAVEVLESDDVLLKVRVLQRAIPRLEAIDSRRACAAARRASAFGNVSAKVIERILDKGLENAPLPSDLFVDDDESLKNPRFARSVHELIQSTMEMTHEPQ